MSKPILDVRGNPWIAERKSIKMIGCSKGNWNAWKRNGCPYLKTQRLKSWRPPGQVDRHFRLKQVQQIALAFKEATKLATSRPSVIKIHGKDHYSTAKAAAYTGMSRTWLLANVLHEVLKARGLEFAYFAKCKLDCLDEVPEKPTDENLLSGSDAAELAGYGETTLRRLAKEGKLSKGKANAQDALGRSIDRTTYRRDEILGLDRFKPLPAQSADADIIFAKEAAALVGCKDETLLRIAKKEKGRLSLGKKPAQDATGRRYDRPTFRKSQLHCLFVHKPAPGEPITLPSGEKWYLDGDAMLKFEISKETIRRWKNRKSIRRPGRALRDRHFYLIYSIGERSRGRPKRRGACNADDLDAIARGEEQKAPWVSGFSLFQRTHGGPARRAKILEFLERLKGRLPIRASDGLAQAQALGFPKRLVKELKRKVGIFTKKSGLGFGKSWEPYWCLAEQSPPQAAGGRRPAASARGWQPTPDDRKKVVLSVVDSLGTDSDGFHKSFSIVVRTLKCRGMPQRPDTTLKILQELRAEGNYRRPD